MPTTSSTRLDSVPSISQTYKTICQFLFFSHCSQMHYWSKRVLSGIRLNLGSVDNNITAEKRIRSRFTLFSPDFLQTDGTRAGRHLAERSQTQSGRAHIERTLLKMQNNDKIACRAVQAHVDSTTRSKNSRPKTRIKTTAHYPNSAYFFIIICIHRFVPCVFLVFFALECNSGISLSLWDKRITIIQMLNAYVVSGDRWPPLFAHHRLYECVSVWFLWVSLFVYVLSCLVCVWVYPLVYTSVGMSSF